MIAILGTKKHHQLCTFLVFSRHFFEIYFLKPLNSLNFLAEAFGNDYYTWKWKELKGEKSPCCFYGINHSWYLAILFEVNGRFLLPKNCFHRYYFRKVISHAISVGKPRGILKNKKNEKWSRYVINVQRTWAPCMFIRKHLKQFFSLAFHCRFLTFGVF